MHPDALPQATKAPPPPQENGGEGEDHSDVSDVTTSCTEVCGKGQWGRSCSKICLAKIYPEGFKDEAIKVYVILFEVFDVKSEPFSYHLRTCSGIMETSGKKAEGFKIESLDGKAVLSSTSP